MPAETKPAGCRLCPRTMRFTKCASRNGRCKLCAQGTPWHVSFVGRLRQRTWDKGRLKPVVGRLKPVVTRLELNSHVSANFPKKLFALPLTDADTRHASGTAAGADQSHLVLRPDVRTPFAIETHKLGRETNVNQRPPVFSTTKDQSMRDRPKTSLFHHEEDQFMRARRSIGRKPERPPIKPNKTGRGERPGHSRRRQRRRRQQRRDLPS